MQVESLKVFCDVARYHSFSQAAAANQVTQSAVSQIVSQIERRLGVQLIDRSVRPLRLTDHGRHFAEGCQEIVSRYRTLEESIRGVSPDVPETVQVAAIYSVGLRDMNQYIEQFSRAQPNALVRIDYLHPDKVHERVLNGTADLGLVSFPRRTRELEALPWRQEEMVLVCAPSHPLSALPGVPPGRLNGVTFIAFDKGLVIRREVDRFLREHDVDVNVAMEFDNIETIKKAVTEEAGVALLPYPTLRPEVETGALVALPLAGGRFMRPLGIIHRKHSLSAAAGRFVKVLQELDLNGDAPTRKRRATAAGVSS
ncbi:MAG: LysR family transcriptional regulator [Lentisphaerae bacterium]|nr:LysR family transcriptional regulator [Lentisphaerota bacterium]